MKNNLVFKFIAILLCAASLMGAVGSVAGVIVLTEADLYNKTVPQVKEERVALNMESYAYDLVQKYASAQLGGCPEQMVTSRTGNMYGLEYQYPNYGYVIKDAEGNALSSYNEAAAQTGTVYSYPASGQYMHLVSLESEAEIQAREAEERVEANGQAGDGNMTVPEDGIVIHHVMFLDANGALIYEAEGRSSGDSESTYYYADGGICSEGHNGDCTGYLFYNQNGELVYNSFFEDYYVNFPETEVAEYFFLNHDEGFVLNASDPEGLGIVSNTNSKLRFVSYAAPAAQDPVAVEQPVEEELPGWIMETIPGSEDRVTVVAPDGTSIEVTLPPAIPEETVPATTEVVAEATQASAEETTPVETAMETVPSSASAVPEETVVTAVTAPVEATQAQEETEATAAAMTPTEPPVTEALAETVAVEETIPEETEPVQINGKPLDEYQVNNHEYHDGETGQRMHAKFVYVPMPELTVEMYVDKDTMRDNALYDLLALVRQVRNYLLPAAGLCLLLFAIFAVYLCTAAGRKPKCEEVRPGGVNRLPLDLYFFGAGFGIACIAAVAVEGTGILLQRDFFVGCGFAVAAAFLASLIFIGFCFAFVAQVKTPGGFWWRNTLCGHSIRLFTRFAIWLENFLASKGFPFLGHFFKWLWRFTCKTVVWGYHALETSAVWLISKMGKLLRWIWSKLHRFLSLMPVTWQWTVIGMFLFCMILIACNTYNDFLTLFGLAVSFVLILYGSHCFGVLLESTKKMGKGDLDTKVDDKLMIGSFKEFAGDLNDLAGVAVIAAQKQLKSERMKTELITNVSHDIKTPLTSIINYVDLLQKPHTPEDEQQYLEVLDRQSQRLKKLIDDLMDMSKANTGNMQVDITQVDAVESVNQALGEFADKLDKAKLIPVFRHDAASVPMMADGRLVWRVLSNLLGNAVKYAMPGTRLYVDLMALEGKVVISLKNISREELNIDADELMERFVRGDDSRNTEGSGLGLNIAKSLMELQKGQLQLLVDGDLFKVTLIFPGV